MRALAAALVVFVGLGTGCGGREDTGAADPPGCPAKIERTELMEISWAPEGNRLAFSTVERGIFLIDARTCVVERVTRGDEPDWSPDGRRLVFARSPALAAPSKLVIAGLHGEDARVLTQGNVDGAGTFPSWSPSGDQIAFTRRGDIHVIQTDGRGLRRLTSTGYNDQPDWSPDGTAIAWECDDAICTMDADGSDSRRVFESSPGNELGNPAWSPDGRSIAFNGMTAYGPPALKIGSARGERVRTFPSLIEGAEVKPTWSPDGEEIAFVGDDLIYHNLYLVRADQSGVRPLTESP